MHDAVEALSVSPTIEADFESDETNADSGITRCALLHFDEGHGPTTTGDKVDFSAGHARALGEDPPTFEAQPPGSNHLRRTPARFGDLTLQLLGPSSSALA